MSVLVSNKISEKDKLPKISYLLSNMLKISIPAALETFLIGLVGLVDTIMVSKVGEEAIAAISISQQPIFISLSACIGLNVGVIAIISRRHGQNDRIGANKSLRHSIIIGFIISLMMSILSVVFAKPFMLLAGAKEDTIDIATSYFQIVSSALIFNYLRLIICSALRATGKTSLTLITNIISNSINVILNYILIGGKLGFPALGVNGAAIATIIGNIVACFVAFFAIYRSKGFLSIKFKDDWRLEKETTKQIFTISSGAFIDQLFVRIGFFISAMIVNNLGTEAVAINAIVNSVISLAFNLTDGFSIGCSALVGKSLGEKRKDIAFAYGRISQFTSVFMAILLISCIIIFRFPLSSLFSDNPNIIDKATKLLLFAGFIIIPQSLQWVTNGVLKGAGDTNFIAKTSLISILIIRPSASFIFCYPLGLGIFGAWMGMFFQQIVRLTLNLIRFHNLKWMRINV